MAPQLLWSSTLYQLYILLWNSTPYQLYIHVGFMKFYSLPVLCNEQPVPLPVVPSGHQLNTDCFLLFRYLVTFSNVVDDPDDPKNIIVWDTKTGARKRTFHRGLAEDWPILKWVKKTRLPLMSCYLLWCSLSLMSLINILILSPKMSIFHTNYPNSCEESDSPKLALMINTEQLKISIWSWQPVVNLRQCP